VPNAGSIGLYRKDLSPTSGTTDLSITSEKVFNARRVVSFSNAGLDLNERYRKLARFCDIVCPISKTR